MAIISHYDQWKVNLSNKGGCQTSKRKTYSSDRLHSFDFLRLHRNLGQEDPTLAIFEDVDGGSERVCRGNNPGSWQHIV
jgi:hypothetical protein